MADRERAHGTLVQVANVESGTAVARQRRLDVEIVERVEVALQFGKHFQDHVVAVELGEILRVTWRWPNASYSVSSISCGWMP